MGNQGAKKYRKGIGAPLENIKPDSNASVHALKTNKLSMLHFFRRIRRDFLANSQFFKYLKYAVGEIVLVVVGILIALYINNWNEQEKKQQEFNSALMDVELELVDNINDIRNMINSSIWYDSICLRYFVDSVKFKKNSRYGALLDMMNRINLKDVSLQRLTEMNGITKEQQSIVNDLIDLNTTGRLNLNDYGDRWVEIEDNKMESFRKYDWYNSYVSKNYNDESFADFVANDQEYSKLAMMMFGYRSGYTHSLARYDQKAVSVYFDIYNYLEGHGIRHSDSLLFQYDPEDYKHYLGKYDSKWSNESEDSPRQSTTISIEGNKLVWNGFYPDEGRHFQLEIIPVNKYHFWLEPFGNRIYLDFDDQGVVKGITLSWGPTSIIKFEKVR